MAESRFWRTLALLFVASLFYLAHGLHEPESMTTLPSMTKELNASDVTLITKPNNSYIKIITSSNDGQTINIWSTLAGTGGADYIGSYTATRD